MALFELGGKHFTSRLLTGTGKYGSHSIMREALLASGTELVTVALKRMEWEKPDGDILSYLKHSRIQILPNTSGARNAEEAVFAARMAREALNSNWIKLEIHPDPRYLLPDPVETLKAAEILVKEGFVVLPYIQADPVLCKRLEEVGTQAVMPLGSPIGSNQGLKTESMLEIIIEESRVPVIVDAGIGAPSHAARAMEMGADAVLINTAIAVSVDPVAMAHAFQQAVEAGRAAREAGMGRPSKGANSTSPQSGLLELELDGLK